MAIAPLLAATGCASLGRLRRRQEAAPKFRTIAYNVFACYGWVPNAEKFKTRQQAAKDKQVMTEMAQQFADALRPFNSDVITFAESPAEWVVKEIADRLGVRHLFFKSGDAYPGALMTRLEIIEWANCPVVGGERPKDLFTRHWGRAVVRTPLGDVVVHSVHLHPSDNAIREREVTEVLEAMQRDFKSGRPVVIQGDFNHTPARPEYARWVAAGLTDTWVAAGRGSEITMPKPTGEPPKRIDFIWTYGPITKRLRDVRVLNLPPFTLVPNDHDSVALSDHCPVMATFA